MRTAQWTASAWKLYKFSLLYLALLFLAMAIDRGVLR
jgi:protoheme IX farnesyltransferase